MYANPLFERHRNSYTIFIVHIAVVVATLAFVHDEDGRSGRRSSPCSNFVLFLQVQSRALEQAEALYIWSESVRTLSFPYGA